MAHILGGIGHGTSVEEEIAKRTPAPAGSTTQTLPEGIEGTPIIVNGQIIGWNIGGEFFTQEEVDALIATGKFPEEPKAGGAGRAPPAFSSTQAAQTQQEEFLAAQAELNRQADIDAAALLAETRGKETRLSTLTSLISDFLNQQSQARNTLANLQPDPFRFAAVAGGVAPFGTTPQQGFQEQLQQFASAPTPTVGPNADMPTLDSAIAGLTGAHAPTAPGVFSAAGGANIPLPAPGQSVAVKVGEKRPDGGSEEILRVTSQGVEVIPLAGGFAHGGSIGDFDFQKIDFNKETLLPALGTSGIFSGGRVPQATFGSAGRLNLGGGRGKSFLQSFGIQPSFVQGIGSSEVFFVDPQTGQRRLLGGNALQLVDPGDITRVQNPANFGQLGAERLGREEALQTLGQVRDTTAFTKFSAPIVEPTTGTLLPAPFTVAAELNQLAVTNPQAFNLLLSAYDAAGVPAQAVISSIQSSLSFGAERGAVGLR